MENPTEHWTEILTGLAATGVEMILAHIDDHPQMGHPLVPLLQISASDTVTDTYSKDIDLILRGGSSDWPNEALEWWFIPIKTGIFLDLKCNVKDKETQLIHSEMGMKGKIIIK